MNTEMTFCCMADCVECSDTSDLCSANRTDAGNPHGRESTCCPAAMEAAEVPSCDNSMAPCAVPLSVRNPPDLASITAADRHAKDDCGDAIAETKAVQHLVTAYVLKHHGTIDASTTECGNYGTLVQMAAACSKRDDCMGFSSVPQAEGAEDTPDCMFITDDHIDIVGGSTNNIYLKREDQFTGHIFKITLGDFGECQSENCGAGSTCCKERKIICTASSGVTVPTGMCSSQVAMNKDARPSVIAKCSQDICDRNNGELSPPVDLTTTTAAPTQADDPVEPGPCEDTLPFCLHGGAWYYYFSLCPDGVEIAKYEYYYAMTYYFNYGPNHAGATEEPFGVTPWGDSEKYYYVDWSGGWDTGIKDIVGSYDQFEFPKLKIERPSSDSLVFQGQNRYVNNAGMTLSPWGYYYYNPWSSVHTVTVDVKCPPHNAQYYYYWSPVRARYGSTPDTVYYYMPWGNKPFSEITFYHNCGCNSSALGGRYIR